MKQVNLTCVVFSKCLFFDLDKWKVCSNVRKRQNDFKTTNHVKDQQLLVLKELFQPVFLNQVEMRVLKRS